MKYLHKIKTAILFAYAASATVLALHGCLRDKVDYAPTTTMRMVATTADAGYVTALHDAQWRRTRNHFIRIQDDCQMCGADKQLQVHHVRPWHLYPELRYEHSNLITLCQPCHFRFGHGRNWQAYNPDITNLVVHVRKSLTNTVYRAE